MSENPYTMNSLGPVWQQGYDAGQAALQSQLERMPCGHRRCEVSDPADDRLTICARCREIQAGIIEMRNKCLNDVIRLVTICSNDPLITKDGRATLITLAESMEDAGPEGFGMDLSAEASVLISRMNELEEYKAKLPADWFKDSSLETWFPLTAEELERTKAKRDSLQSQLERMPCGHRRCDWADMIEEPDKRFRIKVCLSCHAVQEAVSALTAERDALKRELEVAQAAIMEMRQAIEIAISDFASMNQIISKGGALKFPVHPYTQTPAHLQEVIDRLAAKSALEVKPLDRILKGRTAKIDPQDIGAPMLREDK